MLNAAMIGIPRFIELKSKASIDNQNTEFEVVIEYLRDAWGRSKRAKRLQ